MMTSYLGLETDVALSAPTGEHASRVQLAGGHLLPEPRAFPHSQAPLLFETCMSSLAPAPNHLYEN